MSDDDGTSILRDSDDFLPENQKYPWFRDSKGEFHYDNDGWPIMFPDVSQAEWDALEKEEKLQQNFQFMLGPWAGEKHGIFGTRRLHIISGASGAGKSTLAIQLLEAQAKGERCLHRDSFGWPYLIIWQDRGEADLQEQRDNMGLLENPPPYALVSPEQVASGPAAAVEEIFWQKTRSGSGRPKVVFVEGVDMWTEDACDMRKVGTMCSQLLKVAEALNLAIIFSAGSPKRKVKEGYMAVRDRVIGSSAWGRKTSTIVEVVEDGGREVGAGAGREYRPLRDPRRR